MKVSIPKEALDEIKKKYNVSDEEAQHAFLEAQAYAADEFNRALDRELSKGKKANLPSIEIFTPRQIKDYLDEYVIGQEDYKKRICIAAAYHFAMVKYLKENPESEEIKRFRKKNTLIAGPSGSGKTYCIEVLGDMLKVPTLIVDATDYTEAGYVGKSADDMIRDLIDLVPASSRAEQAQFIAENGGIIFIDEIDKKAKEGGLVGHDISREGFQRSILKMIERKQVPIDNPYSMSSQMKKAVEMQRGGEPGTEVPMMSTANVLFIMGGSFARTADSLESIVRKRVEHGEHLNEEGEIIIAGFDAGDGSEKKSYRSFLQDANDEDYVHFGLLPELVGRAPIKTHVNLLSKNDLVRIMSETKDSILNQYRLEFRLFDIDLKVMPEAIDHVAKLAQNRQTGARALVSVWERILTEFQFALPGSGHKELEVSAELCSKPKDALLAMLSKSAFVDFADVFNKEHGIELTFTEDAEKYVRNFADKAGIDLSTALRRLLAGAEALNYMHHTGPFEITKEMVKDSKYFDKLFADWYQKERKKKG